MSNDRNGLCLWFTGLSAAGKTTLCRTAEPRLAALGHRVRVLDADDLRRTMNPELGFTRADRDENVARIALLARNLVAQGYVVLVAAISPYAQARALARAVIVEAGSFVEVHVDAPLELCIRRDPKGLYASALAGKLHGFTGLDDPYEPPIAPDMLCNTAREDIEQSTAGILAAVHAALCAGPAAHSQRQRAASAANQT